MATDTLNFARNFGTNQAQAPASNQEKPKRPPAEYWLNVGYSVDIQMDDNSIETRFISLPLGIPLDQMERLQLGRNELYNQQQTARNDLMDQIMEYAKTLKPGEEATLSLELQIRRVGAPATVPNAAENPFVRKLEFIAR